MKMRKNRMLGILLSFMLVLGSMVGSIKPVYADDPICFDIVGLSILNLSGTWTVDNTPLNGKQISGNGWKYDGKSTVSGNGWTLDLDTFTVTLDGLDYKGSAKGIGYLSGPESLTLNLKGTNSINTTSQCGIESGKGLEINGPGSLSVTSSNNSSCVEVKSNLKVNGGKITVTGTNTSFGAIHCNSLTVSGGDLTAEATASNNNIGILVSENVVVSSGSLTAKGGDTAQENSYGIHLSGTMTVEGGTVDAMSGSARQKSFAITTGIEQNLISGGTVTAAASDAYESIGLDCWNLKVTNGTVTATSGNSPEYRTIGISSSTQLEINGGTVIASAGSGNNSYGIDSAHHYIGSGIQYVEARGHSRGVSGELNTQVNAVGWADYEGTDGYAFLPKGDYDGYDHFGKNVDKRNVQFPDVVSMPVFSLPGGAYNKAQSVTLTSATRGADIYYTTDGTDPSLQNGKKYTGPITVAVSTTIKAIAVKRGLSDSGVVTEEYKLPAPTQAPAQAPAPSNTTVTINSKTVTANSLSAAVAQAGASSDTVTTIVLGKKVSKISKGAFVNYKKAETLEVRTKKLKKASVKNSLKGSHITKVKVMIGNKKTNKSYVKKYKKIFSKKNSCRSVKVTL